jgi:outer membrane protein assembly factor BamB
MSLRLRGSFTSMTATWYDGTLYIATTSHVYALDPERGTLLGSQEFGGRFGIMSPSIVGRTMFLGNSWDWVLALPLSAVRPDARGASGRPGGGAW